MVLTTAQTFNLSAGVVSAGSAAQATGMTGELGMGYPRAKPKNQLNAQLVLHRWGLPQCLSARLFIPLTSASRCIIFPEQHDACTYTPHSSVWMVVTVAAPSPKLPVHRTSGTPPLACQSLPLSPSLSSTSGSPRNRC